MSLRRTLMSQSAIVFGVRLAGAGAVFLIQAAMARVWGSTVLGQYLLAIAAANLLAICLPLGFQTVGNFFAADYAARGQGQSLRRFLLHAYGHILLPGIAVLIGTGWLLPFLGEAGMQLREIWWQVSILAIGTAVIYVNGGVLVGLKRPLAGFFADTIFRPLLLAMGFAILLFMTGGSPALASLMWFMALGYLLVAGVHFTITLTTASRLPLEEPAETKALARWWHFAVPWTVITLASDFFFDVDLLLLSTMLDHEQIAVFGVCARIFVLAAFGVTAVYAISLPGMMEDHVNQDLRGMEQKIATANLAAVGMSLGLLAAVALFGPLVLSLFGEGFGAGQMPLIILSLGLLGRSLFGPASLVMSARNHPYASLPAIGGGLVVLAIGNFILVPVFGLTGAAVAALLALVAGAAGLWLTALRLTGMDVSILPALKQLGRLRAEHG